jgi:hypothetical protein
MCILKKSVFIRENPCPISFVIFQAQPWIIQCGSGLARLAQIQPNFDRLITDGCFKGRSLIFLALFRQKSGIGLFGADQANPAANLLE